MFIRFDATFECGEALSLDETLIRAFGRIGFKVRIITKAARYGIKLYIITDTLSAFVHKFTMYEGNFIKDFRRSIVRIRIKIWKIR